MTFNFCKVSNIAVFILHHNFHHCSGADGKNVEGTKLASHYRSNNFQSIFEEIDCTLHFIICAVTVGYCGNFSGCLFDKGFFNGIIDPGEEQPILCRKLLPNKSLAGVANRDERGRAVDFLGKRFRYKCQVADSHPVSDHLDDQLPGGELSQED